MSLARSKGEAPEEIGVEFCYLLVRPGEGDGDQRKFRCRKTNHEVCQPNKGRVASWFAKLLAGRREGNQIKTCSQCRIFQSSMPVSVGER